MTDPLAPLAELPGVAAAGEEAREALGRAHRHRTNLRGWPTTAAEAAPRAARASSLLADVVTGATRVPAPRAGRRGPRRTTHVGPVRHHGWCRGARLITIASGLDPHGLGVPEVYWMRNANDYRAAARGFASGTPDGLARHGW